MHWWEVKMIVPHESVEAVTALLAEWPEVHGVAVEGRSEDQPLHPEWGEWFDETLLKTDHMVVTVYLPETVDKGTVPARVEALLQAVADAGLSVGGVMPSLVVDTVDETDWENAWKAHYQPLSIGETLAIVPTWQKDGFNAKRPHVIYLEPGMAFGTGTHPTTQLCMETLETLSMSDTVVLDVGCGTGVLAMTAALLGAVRVTAVDIDPVAVHSASTNVTLNSLESQVSVVEGNLLDGWSGGLFDIAVANILRDAVVLLTPQVWNHLKPGGLFLSSGFVDAQADAVEAALVRAGFTGIERRMQEDWVVLMAVKPS